MAVELARRSVGVDLDKCTGCAICAQVCPTGIFDILEKKAVVSRPEDCMGCQLCEAECPEYAITVQRPVLRLRQERPVAESPTLSPAPPPPEPSPVGISAEPSPPPPAPAETPTAGAPGEVMVRGRPLSHYFRPPLKRN